jgi:hypothetical protein
MRPLLTVLSLPGNRLEALKGDRKGLYSINDLPTLASIKTKLCQDSRSQAVLQWESLVYPPDAFNSIILTRPGR